jgi:D-sedoheptulose 7-phosphate isomerase
MGIDEYFEEHIGVMKLVKENLYDKIAEVIEQCKSTLKNGGTIFFMGNGGSAADSQHLAAEFIGRFKNERRSLRSIALTTDTSILTCIGNDYGYDYVFKRQVEGLVKKGDIVVGISTSGNSSNVISAIKAAKNLGAVTIGFLGKDGGKLKDICDIDLTIPSENTARVQEAHITIGHIICSYCDEV